jgi:uncharacterized protein
MKIYMPSRLTMRTSKHKGARLLAAFCLAWLSCQSAAAQTPAAVASQSTEQAPKFKGAWQGPTKRILPGPGLKPGQSLPDYFASLPAGDRRPQKLHVLVLGGSRGFHHDSVPAAMNCIYEAGKRTALWDTEFATDFELLNRGGGAAMKAGFQPKGLKDFDAVVIASASGDWQLSEEQKAAFLSFIHDEGKGLVVIHAGLDANHSWRDYIDMIGGEFTGHPFNSPEHVLVSFPVINESPGFPIVHHLPVSFRKQDEWYVVRNWSRSEVNVLLRLDGTKLDYSQPEIGSQIPPDHDFPLAWTKRYGKGRVFVSSVGHHSEAFSDADIVQMYTEGTKWALGLTEGDERPHKAGN